MPIHPTLTGLRGRLLYIKMRWKTGSLPEMWVLLHLKIQYLPEISLHFSELLKKVGKNILKVILGLIRGKFQRISADEI